MICRKCGAQIPDNSAVCSFCGAEYEVAPVEEETSAAENAEQKEEALGVDALTDETDIMLDENEKKLKELACGSSDVVFRSFYIGKVRALIVYLDGMVNLEQVEESIIKSLIYGIDKPDMRFGMTLHDLTDALRGTEFKAFSGAMGRASIEEHP